MGTLVHSIPRGAPKLRRSVAAFVAVLGWGHMVAGCSREGELPATGDSTTMVAGSQDQLCFDCYEESCILVDAVESTAPQIVRATHQTACVVVEALAEGVATLHVETSKGHVTLTVESVRPDYFVLRLGSDVGYVVGPGPTNVEGLGFFGQALFVEWHQGDRVLRGVTDTGYALTVPGIAELNPVQTELPTDGSKGTIMLYVDRLGPGTTQVMWNDVPGPVLIVP